MDEQNDLMNEMSNADGETDSGVEPNVGGYPNKPQPQSLTANWTDNQVSATFADSAYDLSVQIPNQSYSLVTITLNFLPPNTTPPPNTSSRESVTIPNVGSYTLQVTVS